MVGAGNVCVTSSGTTGAGAALEEEVTTTTGDAGGGTSGIGVSFLVVSMVVVVGEGGA